MSTPFEQFGKYVLLEKLATGGMAEVFLARGSGAAGVGKFFAIKRILPQYADSPEFIDMFKDEAKIAINLTHSNIVSIHEFGVEKGIFYLVMDYVEGRNLRQILNKMKKASLQFSMDQIVYIIKEAAGGLDHAHRCLDGSTGKPLNITHRDMSPQNLMVSFEGEVKIVDFGIAKAESQLETTRAGTLKGKFGYMSPEQAEGQAVDLRTDIFSLGIVIWELLANDRLFVANNEINTLRKIRDCQIPSLRKINPNIHTELERIVQKALARDRNLRYQTAAALHRDLNRFLNRQYPDFSPQDFSIFVKSVFADEIMSVRKRVQEYAKINISNTPALSPAGEKNFDDRTSLLANDTNSLVVSRSGADLQAPSFPERKDDALNAETAQLTQGVDIGKPHEHNSVPDIKAEVKDDSLVTASANTLELSATGPVPEPQALPPPPRAHTVSTVLDEGAIKAEMKRDLVSRARAPVLETEPSSSPSIRYQNNRSYPRQQRMQKRTQTNNMKVATFLVFSMLCVSVYAYLAKYFTPMMADVITATDPVLHPFHVALNVEVGTHESVNSSHKPQAVQAAQPVAPQQIAQPQIAAPPGPTMQQATKPFATNQPVVEDESAVVVISNPSGAEIYINDKPTGMVTPSRVNLPPGKFNLTLQKSGYVPNRMTEQSKDTLGHRVMVALVKMNVAYVDLEVFPPQEATFYINGKKVGSRKVTMRQMPIPAYSQVKIRAETATGFDEVQISLAADRRQNVQLHPRKSLRIPSGSDSNIGGGGEE